MDQLENKFKDLTHKEFDQMWRPYNDLIGLGRDLSYKDIVTAIDDLNDKISAGSDYGEEYTIICNQYLELFRTLRKAKHLEYECDAVYEECKKIDQQKTTPSGLHEIFTIRTDINTINDIITSMPHWYYTGFEGFGEYIIRAKTIKSKYSLNSFELFIAQSMYCALMKEYLDVYDIYANILSILKCVRGSDLLKRENKNDIDKSDQ